MKKTFSWFRKFAIAEGVSFLVLLLIAMPLKYLANIPIAVTIAGGIHGFLFIGFMILAFQAKDHSPKPHELVRKGIPGFDPSFWNHRNG